MKYTINELANSKGVSQPVREALLQMEAELEATNRQVEILSDALAESRREVAALKDVPETDFGNMTKDEALKLALYALEIEDAACRYMKDETPSQIVEAITAIKQARSAPVQEPVGVFVEDDDIGHVRLIPHQQLKLKDGDKLYTTPPAAQRQWVGLPDDEIEEMANDFEEGYVFLYRSFARAIEAKLRSKNT
jgi:hypothetical protein